MSTTASESTLFRRPPQPKSTRATHQPARHRDWSGLSAQDILARYRPGRADPMQVLEVLLKLFNQQHTALMKTVSHKTRQERADLLRRFFRDLHERAGFKTLPATRRVSSPVDPRFSAHIDPPERCHLHKRGREKPNGAPTCTGGSVGFSEARRGSHQWLGARSVPIRCASCGEWRRTAFVVAVSARTAVATAAARPICQFTASAWPFCRVCVPGSASVDHSVDEDLRRISPSGGRR